MEMHHCINFILSNAQNAVYGYFKRRLQEYDITPSQYSLLQCLHAQDGQTPSQLAQAMRLDTSSITGILGRLEKKNLIDRVYSQEDRRSVYIHLREEGQALWEQVDKVIDEANEKITRGLDAEHYAEFLSCLSLIEHNTEGEE
jgi:DNA-binding MarR family transcriptional regulator